MVAPVVAAGLAAAPGLMKGLFDIVDNLFTSDEERDAAKLKLIQLEHEGRLEQLKLNAVEASHENVFVAGWRPFIGWTCGAVFAYKFIIYPFMGFAAVLGGITPEQMAMLPQLDVGEIYPVLLGMLGMSGLRTYEKLTGTNTNRGAGTPVPAKRKGMDPIPD